MKIHEQLKSLRLENNLTQEELSKILNISLRAYAYYEKGERTLNVDILISICKHYKVSSDFILGLNYF